MPSRIEDLSEDERLALGILHAINWKEELAFKYLKPLADAGNIEAQTRLGYELISGNLNQERRIIGLAYLQSAAKKGSLWAKYHLATDKIMIREGEEIPEDRFDEGIADFRELAELCRVASEQNDAKAEYILAQLYEGGYGVRRDPNEARRYYARAWVHGDQTGLPAMNLTLLYSLDEGKSPEMSELHQLWRERARWEGIDRIAADW